MRMACSRDSWRAGVVGAVPITAVSGGGSGGLRPTSAGARAVGAKWQGQRGLRASGRAPGCDRTAPGVRWHAEAVRLRARAKRVLWARPEHARYMLDIMPGWPRGLGCKQDLTGLV